MAGRVNLQVNRNREKMCKIREINRHERRIIIRIGEENLIIKREMESGLYTNLGSVL